MPSCILYPATQADLRAAICEAKRNLGFAYDNPEAIPEECEAAYQQVLRICYQALDLCELQPACTPTYCDNAMRLISDARILLAHYSTEPENWEGLGS